LEIRRQVRPKRIEGCDPERSKSPNQSPFVLVVATIPAANKKEGSMLGLDMLDVAIGVIFVYLLLSLIASAAAEVWESKWRVRADFLERGLLELLRDKDLVAKLYNHPLINGLYKGTYGDPKTKPQLPTYIPTRSFALAIMDLLLSSTGTTPAATPSDTSAAVLAMRTTVDTTAVTMQAPPGNTPPPDNANSASTPAAPANQDPLIDQARHAVVLLTNAAGGDAEQARKNIEDWYNAGMDRVSGWYKRRTQWFLFGIGLVVAIVLNVDSIRVVTALSTDKPKRDAIVGIATAYQKANTSSPATATDTTGATKSVAEAEKQTSATLGELNKLGLPIGWTNYGCSLCENTPQTVTAKDSSKSCWWLPCPSPTNLSFTDAWKKARYSHWLRCWLLVFVGWLITALAVSLGAPFWFDMLNKIIVVRSTVKPQEKSGTEAPKDPPKK
jgi:hypothetical protein